MSVQPDYRHEWVPVPPPLVRPTSTLAVVGFILSILWLAGLGSAAAIVLCALARKKTRPGIEGGNGLAIAGLVVGIIGVVPVVLWVGALATVAALALIGGAGAGS